MPCLLLIDDIHSNFLPQPPLACPPWVTGRKVRRLFTNAYIPIFRNLKKQGTNFLRGYASGISSGRELAADTSSIDTQLTENLLHPKYSRWYVSSWMMDECVPLEKNHMRLHDIYRTPESHTDIYGDNCANSELRS